MAQPDPELTSHVVLDPSGGEATLESRSGDTERISLRLGSGQRIEVPVGTIEYVDGAYRSSLDFSTILDHGGRLVVPLVEERVEVEKRVRETGRVRLTKRVETHEAEIDEPLLREDVEVEHVPIGRYVEDVVGVRHDGDTTIIPIYEEVLVVEKRLLLKEELHITKRQIEVRDPQRITLRTERVEVERFTSADGAPEGGAER